MQDAKDRYYSELKTMVKLAVLHWIDAIVIIVSLVLPKEHKSYLDVASPQKQSKSIAAAQPTISIN